jgi:D-amino-acid dehydrogenase
MSSSGDDHTIVIGGGIVGLCTAYYLAQRGRRVTVYEQGDLSQNASAGNAGIVALGHLPLPRPGLARKALGWMFDGRSPLYIRPRPDLTLVTWLWQFHRACTWARVATCMEILAILGRETITCWEEIIAEASLSCDYRAGGWLDVYRSQAGRIAAGQDAELTGRYGFAVREYVGDDLRQREAAFTDEVLGAIHYPDSAFLDPARFLVALARYLPNLGVTVKEGITVRELLTNGRRCTGVRLADDQRDQATSVVLAAGVWSTALARAVGIPLPMQAGKGYHLDLTPPPSLRTACVLNEGFIAVNPLADVLRLAGTVEFSGLNHDLHRPRLEMLREGAGRYLRGIANLVPRSEWCGLRPCTADGLPIVGWAPGRPGLFVATGHAKMGLTLGPITGRLVSECILDGRPSLDITPLSPDRF